MMKVHTAESIRQKLPDSFSPMLSVAQVAMITGQKEGVVRSWFEAKYGKKKRKKLPFRRTTENQNSSILIYYKDLQFFLLNVLCWPIDFVELWVRQLPEQERNQFYICEAMHREKQKTSVENCDFPNEAEFSQEE